MIWKFLCKLNEITNIYSFLLLNFDNFNAFHCIVGMNIINADIVQLE
jgi:hypothetical protein